MYRKNSIKRIFARKIQCLKAAAFRCYKKTIHFICAKTKRGCRCVAYYAKRTTRIACVKIKRAFLFVAYHVRKAYYISVKSIKSLFRQKEKRVFMAAGAIAVVAAIVLVATLTPVKKAEVVTVKAETVIDERPVVYEETAFDFDLTKAIPASTKNEMVVISCDATGKNKEITDRVTLSGFSEAEEEVVKDVTNLQNIENVNGEEAFKLDNGSLYWENLQKDIVYEGKGTKETPVKINIKYYLDGKEVSAQNLEGESGKIKIVVSYENSKKGNEYVPYTATSLLTLDKECFTNITTNGTTVESGFNMMVYKSSYPGLEENLSLSAGKDVSLGLSKEFIVEADVEDFSLEGVVTVVSNGIFSDIDDSKLDSITNLGDLGNLLNGYGYQLAAGASDLCAGMGLFREGLNTLYSGSSELTDSLEEYSKGISSLRSGLDQLVSTVSFLPDVSDSLKQAQEAVDSLAEYLRNICDKAVCIEAAIEACIEVGDEETTQALYELQEAIYCETSLDCIKEKIIACLELASLLLQSAYEQVDAFYDGLVDADEGAISLEEASALILQAQKDINNGIASLQNNFSAIENGGAAIKEGADQFLYSVNNAGDMTDSQTLSKVMARIKELKLIDQKPHFYSGGLDSTTGSTTYMFNVEY